MSDTALVVASADGDVRVALAPPVAVYARVPADLAQVTEHVFVGVTSVAQRDGSQRATEIHIFPEELRGTNEGSFLMAQQGGGGDTGRSTMTNGTVAGGGGAEAGGGAPRMTNGTIRSQAGGTLTVRYRGGEQTIAIPPDVRVTAIARSTSALTAGSNVVVLATKRPDGSLQSSAVLLAAGQQQKK